MGLIKLTRSEQDFYDNTIKQANALMTKAQADAQTLITETVQSICESHDAGTPQSFEPVKNKAGKTIAMLWGKEQKDWREGSLQLDGCVYPPGLPVKPAATPGAPAST